MRNNKDILAYLDSLPPEERAKTPKRGIQAGLLRERFPECAVLDVSKREDGCAVQDDVLTALRKYPFCLVVAEDGVEVLGARDGHAHGALRPAFRFDADEEDLFERIALVVEKS